MSYRRAATWLHRTSGASAVANSSWDIILLLAARFVRQIAFGCTTIILVPFFSALGHSDTKLGLFMTLTLLGDGAISLVLTGMADSWGRRKILVLAAAGMVGAGVVFAVMKDYWFLLLAAIIGVVSPSGNEVGPFKAIEESTLAHLTGYTVRSDIYAWYVVLATIGVALGVIGGGWLVEVVESKAGWTSLESFRAVFWVYAGLGVVILVLSLSLSGRCEHEKAFNVDGDRTPQDHYDDQAASAPLLQDSINETPTLKANEINEPLLSKSSRMYLIKIIFLFALNSLGSGMVPISLVTSYVEHKFSLPHGKLGSIISATLIFGIIPVICSSALSKRFGLIKTMVGTHLPSAIFLAVTPLPASLGWTVFFLAARACIGTMDQAPCSVLLSLIFPRDDLTRALGILNITKTLSNSAGPAITGVLMNSEKTWIAFVAAGALKAAYDLGLLIFFAGVSLTEGGYGVEDSR